MLKVVEEQAGTNATGGPAGSLIDEIVRDGARQMLAAALAAGVAAYIEQYADLRDEDGHRLMVRNGFHDPREVTTAAGAVQVRAPRVNDLRTDEATGERQRFASAILPAWSRKSPQVAAVLPLLYLHGLSSGDFGPALEQFRGSGQGLSASTITRLTEQWQGEARRRGAGVLVGPARGVPGHPRAALLVPQVRECPCSAAEISAARGDQGYAGDLQRRGRRPC